MMDIHEETIEKCHKNTLNAAATVEATASLSGGGKCCEYLAKTRKLQNTMENSENKQNIEFGAQFAAATTKTTSSLQTTKTAETFLTKTTATEAAAAAVVDPLEIPAATEKVAEEDVTTPQNATNKQNAAQQNVDDEEVDDDEDDDDDEEDDDDAENTDESSSSSSDSDFSDLSGLSDESGREWKPVTKPINWVQKQIHSGANPRDLLSQMLPNSGQIAPGLNDSTLWRILASMLSEPPRRQKLRYINTFADVIQLVREAKNIIVLTGAGVSVSCGIPDFRSSDGIYSRLAKDFPDLPDPQAMFDINYFSRDPRPFYKFAREIYPGQFTPSPCHRFIKLLEKEQKLLRNYTQNIDTLEQVAGIQNVIECHGSFSTASCTKCKFRTTADAIREDIFVQRIPVCPRCQPNVQQSVDASEPVSELELKQIVENGIMKPDIVFFGEGLPEKFHTVMASDKDKCDLLIVMGSSLKVRPVALIPSSIPAHVPQILINREQLHHLEFDVELLGDSDVIINQLCHHLGSDWKEICFDEKILQETKELQPFDNEVNADAHDADEGVDDGDEGVDDGGGGGTNTSNSEADDAPQFLTHDTDTQSVKSNASTDIALRSAGAYSDSGFESSTSSGVASLEKMAVTNVAAATTTHTAAINHHLTTATNTAVIGVADLLTPPHLLDDNMDAIDFEHHPNAAHFHDLCGAESYRHLSIDSSKDSGINDCSSSNSATVGNAAAALSSAASAAQLLPPATENTTAVTKATKVLPASSLTATERKIKRRQQKRLSAAERLLAHSYYCHEATSSYVFPGAQVSWYSDSEDDDEDGIDEATAAAADAEIINDDDDDDEEDDVDFVADVDDVAAALTPLLPPAIAAQMVKDIMSTTTAAGAGATSLAATTINTNKRRSAEQQTNELSSSNQHNKTSLLLDSNKIVEAAAATTTPAAACSILECSPPPSKKRRDVDAPVYSNCSDNSYEATTAKCSSLLANSNKSNSSSTTLATSTSAGTTQTAL